MTSVEYAEKDPACTIEETAGTILFFDITITLQLFNLVDLV